MRWSLIQENDFLQYVSDESDTEEEVVDKKPALSVIGAVQTVHQTSGTGRDEKIEYLVEFEIEYNSKLFLDIINRMQIVKNHLQLIGEPLTLCISFMVEVAVDLENVNIDLLRESGFKFTLTENHCSILLKCFSD